MKGKRIDTLKKLDHAVTKSKAVIVPGNLAWVRPKPSAFVIHLPAIQLLRLFKLGMYEYIKENKPKEPKPMTWQKGKLIQLNERED